VCGLRQQGKQIEKGKRGKRTRVSRFPVMMHEKEGGGAKRGLIHHSNVGGKNYD